LGSVRGGNIFTTSAIIRPQEGRLSVDVVVVFVR